MGAWNHHPLTAHAAIAAAAAFSDWTSVSRSGPASTNALRADLRTSAHSRTNHRPAATHHASRATPIPFERCSP
ncbi:hypothetical protein [Streptomyces rubiginosohelvolus]